MTTPPVHEWSDPQRLRFSPPDLQLVSLRSGEQIVPEPLSGFIESVADALQVPRLFVYLPCLTALSAATRGNITVRVKPDWVESAAIYSMPVMKPGTRKSAVLRVVTEPLHQLEKQWQKDALPLIESRKVEHARAIDARSKLEKASKNTGTDVELLADIEAAVAAVEATKPPAYPQLFADDITPEALGHLLAEQPGVAVIDAEGGFLDILGGRYDSQGKANTDAFCKAYDAESFTVRRRGAEPIHCEKPFLAVCIAAQPDVLRDLVSNRKMTGRGAAHRFLFGMASDLLGERSAEQPPMKEPAKRAWAESIEGIARHVTSPREMTVSSVGWQLFNELHDKIEPRMAEGGDLAHFTEWVGKLAGKVVRIAALYTLAADPQARQVEDDHLRQALNLHELFIDHALAAFFPQGKQPLQRVLDKLLEWENEVEADSGVTAVTPSAGIAVRDLLRKMQNQTWLLGEGANERLCSQVRKLGERGWVSWWYEKRQDTTRTPTAMLKLHPDALKFAKKYGYVQ